MVQQTIHPYIFLLFLSALIGFVIAFLFYWQRQPVAYARPFILMMVATSWWALTYGIELLQRDLAAMLFMINLEYLGILSGAVLLFIFISRFTGWDGWLGRFEIAGLFVIPFFILLAVWTNPWHGLYYTETGTIERGTLVLAALEAGVAYWVSVVYNYTLLLSSVILLLLALRNALPPYRSQLFLLLFAILSPWVGNFVYNFVIRRETYLDTTPVMFILSGAIIALGLFRYRLLDLLPVARNRLVEMMEDGWIVLDQKGRLVDLNQTAALILQGERDRLIGRPFSELPSSSAQTLVRLPVGQAQQLEAHLPDATSNRYYDVRQMALLPEHGQAGGHLIVLRDISERRLTEIALQQLTNALEMKVASRTADIRAEKLRIETILRNVDEGVALTDDHFILQYANERFAQIVNQDPASLPGESVDAVLFAPGDASRQAMIGQALRAGQSWQTEITAVSQEDNLATYRVTAVPVRANSDRQLTSIVWTLQDVSQMRRLEQARAQFVTNISHQFRTPLTNVKLYISLLQRLEEMPERADRYLQVLQDQAERLERLTQSILTLAGLDSLKQLPMEELVEIEEVITVVFDQFTQKANDKQVALRWERGERPLHPLRGDSEKIRWAIAEFVRNSLNFTPPGGSIVVRVHAEQVGLEQWLTLSVRDSGPGVLPAERHKVFERFFRGSLMADGHQLGVGLGLSIVAEIARLHQGEVSYCDNPDGGSCFLLRLPIVPQAQTKREAGE